MYGILGKTLASEIEENLQNEAETLRKQCHAKKTALHETIHAD